MTEQAEYLKRIAETGSAEAGVALSSLLKLPVEVLPVSTWAADLKEMKEPEGEIFVAVYFTLHGADVGSVVMILSRAAACRMVDAIRSHPARTTQFLGEPELSLLREVSNILVGAYLGAVRVHVQIPLIHSVPMLAIDGWRPILDSLLPMAMASANLTTMIESELVVQGIGVHCYLLLIAAAFLA